MSDTQKDSRDKTEVGLSRLKEGLPHQAYAIVSDSEYPETWKLPHHTKAIAKAIRGKIGHYRTTDWEHLSAAVAALSRGGFEGKRVEATEQQILDAARHLMRHCQDNGKPVPDTLAVLVE
ncbi:MAG: hypothetical protein H8D32_01200 [Dehalococcoidia bacterium]|nr:hypothetical protein [Dehalococcoidia bacterium]